MNDEELKEIFWYNGICDCGKITKVPLYYERNNTQIAYRGSCKKCGEIFSVIVKKEDINKLIKRFFIIRKRKKRGDYNE